MFEYFYHEILRKTIISFGTLFNNITIQTKRSNGDITSTTKVPLAYGPTQKFLARLEQQADLNKGTAMTLPRMSFEFTGLTYDPTRKVTTTQQFTIKDPKDGSTIKKAYMPVPYSMAFELSVMTKLNDDALQIVEQILPYFQPAYNLSVNLTEEGENRDIPVVLENVTMEDNYEGDFSERRVLLYTFRFTAKTYLFGPVSSVTSDIIKSVKVSYLAGNDPTDASRDLAYRVKPRALKSYTGVVTTNLSADLTADSIVAEVADGTTISQGSYLDIEGEQVYVKTVTGDKLKLDRGRDGTDAVAHVNGAPVKAITAADNALVQFGDDFGFDGSIE